MPRISGVVIAYNEEQYIGQCLESLKRVVDEIVVVDSGSADRTAEISRSMGAVCITQPFLGYIEQKNFALAQATYDHVLSLDADEMLSDELAEAILAVKDSWSHDAYCFNRLNRFCGQWLRYTNFYPDRKLRLWDRRKGRWGGVNPHDRVVMQKGASVARLPGDLLHYMCDSYEEHLDTINRFSTIAAKEAFKRGIGCSAWKVLYKTCWRFIQHYVVKAGFLMGYTGFVVSYQDAFHCFQKYARLRHLIKNSGQSAKQSQADGLAQELNKNQRGL